MLSTEADRAAKDARRAEQAAAEMAKRPVVREVARYVPAVVRVEPEPVS